MLHLKNKKDQIEHKNYISNMKVDCLTVMQYLYTGKADGAPSKKYTYGCVSLNN